MDPALRQLRRFTVLLPLAFLTAVEVGVHLGIGDRVPRYVAVLIALGTVLVATIPFTAFVFSVVNRIHRRLVRQNRQLAAVHNAALSLASTMSLEPLLQQFVDLAREITNARYGALGILGPDGNLEHFITSGISEEERARIGDPPTGKGLLGVIINEGTSLRLRDLTKDPRSAGFPPHHPVMHSLLGVPVVYKGKILGRLYLAEKQDAPEFSEEDEEMVRLFAAQAATSIENARLFQRSQDLAILEERERIGMDLHDGVIQSLYAVGLNLEECAELVSEDPEFVAKRLDKAINDMNQVIKDIRSYIFHLRPAAFTSNDLRQALEDLAREVRVNSLIEVEVSVDGVEPDALPEPVAENLFHIAQEALANVAKHSGATQAWARLERQNGTCVLTIADNGKGFDVSRPGGVGHRGLGNMADRARSIGGVFKLTSGEGKGTCITVAVPLEGERLDA